ncbi:MAG: HAMP domain-containing histidine kinase [Prolixibacteraceae bacterium]|nr:HAMP domain-containing histidine kinase [Prolixibacteraceae bacterium]
MVSLHIVVEDSIALTLGNATTKKISIINKISENTKAWCDSAMMYTIVQNILANSIKFTNNDGKIVISCKKAPSKNGIVLSVLDNDVGMDSSKAANLFRKKQNNSTLGTNGEKGLGLGLIICKEFIEALNGKIWAESSPGNGTIMNVYLRTKNKIKLIPKLTYFIQIATKAHSITLYYN